MDADSGLANVLEIMAPIIAVVGVVSPTVSSALKGRWWMGVIGAVAFVGSFAVLFVGGGVEPSAEFQKKVAFQVVNAAINVALLGGLILLIYGSLRAARSGSWWDRRRGAEPTP